MDAEVNTPNVCNADGDADDEHWVNGYPSPIANPMSIYPQHEQLCKSWSINSLGSVVVEVECEDGSVGVGEVECVRMGVWE